MSEKNRKLALPTPSQAAWADAEIGVIIHFDMQVFDPEYSFRKRWGYTPDPSVFNPKELDTPMSGRYLRFIAKHVLDDVDYVVVAGIGVVESKRA